MTIPDFKTQSDCIVREYISAGCNPVPHCMDWGLNGLMCYGASNSVIVFKPKDEGGWEIVQTLAGHTGRVNSVSWVQNCDKSPEVELISASSDKTAIIWDLKEGKFEQNSILKGHKDSVNVVTGTKINDYTLVVTASADSTVKIWKKSSAYELFHTIDIPDNGFSFCAKIVLLTKSDTPLLLLSIDDKVGKLLIYSIADNATLLTTLIGHDDWIRDMDFILLSNGDSLLATGSQDSTVCLWRFSEYRENMDKLHVKSNTIEIDGMTRHISHESILHGHEDRVCGVQWADSSELKLMSCSLDRSIIEWSQDADSGVWLEKVRLGEIGGDNVGFVGAKYSPKCDSIFAYTHHSAFHKWKRNYTWIPDVHLSGHNQGVADIAWEREGRYLLSTSLDQTTRLHSVWKPINSWHEMSRPQIHGYSMNSIATLKDMAFVSAADEKVARVFKVPKNVLSNLNKLCEFQLNDMKGSENSNAKGASVSALGLSNKAVYDNDETNQCEPSLTEPPTEDVLVKDTLWPEIKKLYGHGNQVYALASSRDGKIIASAAKASNKQDATIIIWDTSSWEQIQTLEEHNLTVTKMEFSPDDQKLISVSRDRTWRLYEKQDQGFVLKTTIPKGYHSRIIWDCSWTYDSKYFATCSRDCSITGWTNSGEPSGILRHPKNQPITTLDFAPVDGHDQYFLALGCENGVIDLLTYRPEINEFCIVFTINNNSHVLTVTRLRFNPKSEEDGGILLASCSNDQSVRINRIYFHRLITLFNP